MSDTYLAFLKPRNFFEKIIAKIDGGKYCHVELAVKNEGKSYTAYSSTRKTGVRKRKATFKSKHWVLVPVYADASKCEAWYQQHHNEKYDYLGAMRSRLSFIPQFTHRWFCVEMVASILGMENPSKLGLKELYELIQ